MCSTLCKNAIIIYLYLKNLLNLLCAIVSELRAVGAGKSIIFPNLYRQDGYRAITVRLIDHIHKVYMLLIGVYLNDANLSSKVLTGIS